MSPGYLLGLDVGSSSGRCLVVDVDRGRTTSASRSWSPRVVSGTGNFGFDFSADEYWGLLGEAVREALARAGAGASQVLGISVTSMRHSLILLGQNGSESLAVPNRDARAAGQAMQLAEDHGSLLHRRTGHWPAPIFLAARLRWVSEERPGLLEQTMACLQPSDWIGFRLTGQVATDPSQAAESLLFDLEKREWAQDLLELLGLPRAPLPSVRASGTLLGRLTPAAAEAFGLHPGIPVSVGGADTQCGLLGMGAVVPGQLGVVAGSTTPVQMVVDRPMVDDEARIWTGCHVVPGMWVLESNAAAMGESVEWIARLLFPSSTQPVARLMAEAGRSKPGADGLISTFGVQVMNARDMALPAGSLTMSHLLRADAESRRSSLARALIEGVAYSVVMNMQQIASVAGREPNAIKVTGGVTRSEEWLRILAAALNRPLEVSMTHEASALGAAMCAGVGAAVFADLSEAAARLRHTRMIEPDPDLGAIYADHYQAWKMVFEAQAKGAQAASGLIMQGLTEQAEPTRAETIRPRPRVYASAQLDDKGLPLLRRLGDVTYASYREAMNVLTGDSLVEALQGYDVFITEVDIVDLEALRRLPDLRVVVACRGNAVNVDIPACTAMGVPVLNTPGRNAEAVADLTLAFMLILARRLVDASGFLREPGAEAGDMGRMGQAHSEFLGKELWGKAVGLVGLGAVGRAVARRLQPFGATVLVYDPYVSPDEIIRLDASPVDLDELLSSCDFISLHAAVTDKTRGMIGAARFARVKRGACLVNTARAALVDHEALLHALRTGILSGAALDVFPVEPPGFDDPLLALPNVIATPHIGGNTVEVAEHQSRIIYDDLVRMVDGGRPVHILNPKVLEHFGWRGPRHEYPEELPKVGAAGPAVSDLQVRAEGERKASPREATPSPVAQERRLDIMEVPVSPRQQMEKVLRLFLDKAARDPEMNAYAARAKVAQLYTVIDMGLEFYMAFRDGKVFTGLGAPDQPAEVRMKAKAEILDGIFTGQISGNKAAMSGKLSFSGDVRLAMGLQKIQKDLIRLYTEARQEAGGLQLAAQAAPPAGTPLPGAAVTHAAPPVGATVAPGDPRLEIIEVLNELYASQLVTATGGNISVRIPGKDEAWITPSAMFKGSLTPEMMVRINLEGSPVDAEALSPSSERLVHTEIYRARPDVEAVIHAHAPYGTILMMSGIPFQPITTEAAFLKEVPVVPFIMPGTSELAKAVARALDQGTAVFMQNHGVVVAGSSLRSAANKLEVIERTAHLILGCYSVGKKPPLLPKDTIAMLRDVGDLTA